MSNAITGGITTQQTWNLPAHRADHVRRVVTKANRRATRAGLPTYTVTITPGPDRPVYDDLADDFGALVRAERVILYWEATIDVTVTGATPRIAGWDVVASVTEDPEAGMLVRALPGIGDDVDLTEMRQRESGCDQCRKNRHRKDTFVVRNTTTGELRQIGRSCLALFFGLTVSFSADAFHGNLGEEIDEFADYAGADVDVRYSTLSIVEMATAAVAAHGWVSVADADMPGERRLATSVLVRNALGRSVAARTAARRLAETLTDQLREKAAAVVAHARTMGLDPGDSNYAINLGQIARPERVTARNVGLLVSAVAVYDREQERAARAAIAGTSEWQGQVKTRGTFAGLTVVLSRLIDDDWQRGPRYLNKFVDPDGNVFTWFTGREFEAGERYDVTATVKEHTEYQGAKETKLLRCKLAPVA